MRYDVVIVGGGLLGQFAALELLSRGYRVAIVEKEVLCSGSCSKSSGIMTRQLVLRADIVFAQRSIEIVTKLEKELGDHFFRRTGFLTLSPVSRVTKRLEMIYRSLGIRYSTLDPEEIRELWRDVGVNDKEIGIYTEDDGILDVGSISYRIKKEIERGGGSIFEGCGETILIASEKHVVKAVSENNVCSSHGDLYMLNVGTGTSTLFSRSFEREPQPKQILFKCQSASIDLGEDHKIPIIYDGENHLYIAPETLRRAIAGDGPCEIAKDQNDIAPNREALIEVLDKLLERLPSSDRSTLLGVVSYICDSTPDLLPVVGRDSVYENLYIAYGLSSYGIMRSPYLGIEMARMIDMGNIDPALKILEPRPDKGLRACEETHTPLI